MAKDDFKIINNKIINNKNKVVSHTKHIKKGFVPVVLHNDERVIQKDINKLKQLEKKYKVNLYPKKKTT